MAISPPSDIVLDVMRAADPAAVAAARQQLAHRSNAPAPAFSQAVPAAPRLASDDSQNPAPRVESFRKFEAMVLQTFIQTMLPKDAENVYGKGMAGDMWKGLMSEKLAGAMSARGGIGIADRLLAGHYVEAERAVPVGPLSRAWSEDSMLSTALVEKMQIRLARSLGQHHAARSDSTKL